MGVRALKEVLESTPWAPGWLASGAHSHGEQREDDVVHLRRGRGKGGGRGGGRVGVGVGVGVGAGAQMMCSPSRARSEP